LKPLTPFLLGAVAGLPVFYLIKLALIWMAGKFDRKIQLDSDRPHG